MLKVELHTHTKYSYDCIHSFDSIIRRALRKKVDVIAITDHNEIEGAFRLREIAPFRIIIGEEILTKDGEIIGLFLDKLIKPGLGATQTIKEIRRQGGLVYLPHPYDNTTRKTSLRPTVIQKLIGEIDIVEIHNGRTIMPEDNLMALSLARRNKKAEAVGSDAHSPLEFGRNINLVSGFYSPKEFLERLAVSPKIKKPPLPHGFVVTKWSRVAKKTVPSLKKTIKTVCNQCGGLKFDLIYKRKGKVKNRYLITDDSYGMHEQIVRCRDCGLVFANPTLSDKKILDRYFSFTDERYEDERETRKKNYVPLVREVEKLSKKRKILDVGAATGMLVEVADERGWDAFGIEPSLWAVNRATKRKLKVFGGTLPNRNIGEDFDAIACIDVIEHVVDPRSLIRDMGELMKRFGVLVIVTPNIGSVMAKILGENWWHIRPDHIYYFSKKTITTMLRSEGFEILKVKNYAWNFSLGYWLSRLAKLKFIAWLISLLKKSKMGRKLLKINIKINFGDSLVIYAKKIK